MIPGVTVLGVRCVVSCLLVFACLVLVAPMAPAQAITSGVPDNNRHPYVGEMLFYDPDDADPRFADPGGWFTCTGTLVDSTHVVTAGHCTHATGLNGHSTTAGGGSGSGGNDVWISFAEVPNFDVLPREQHLHQQRCPVRRVVGGTQLEPGVGPSHLVPAP